MTRTVYGSASPREIYALAATCEQLPRLKALARPFGSAEITALLADIDELSDIKELIFAAVDENAPAMLKDGASFARATTPRWTSCGTSSTAAKVTLPRWRQSSRRKRASAR